MSLNFNLKTIENYEEVCYNGDELKGQTQGLIFLTMSVGIGEITAKNCVEFYARTRLVEAIHGPMCHRYEEGKPPIPMPCADVALIKAHIGLTTNASLLTRRAFLTQIFDIALLKAEKAFNA